MTTHKPLSLVSLVLALAIVFSPRSDALPRTGDMMLFAGKFDINGWSLCDGKLQQKKSSQRMARLLGKRFGGDGTTTFGLPNLSKASAAMGKETCSVKVRKKNKTFRFLIAKDKWGFGSGGESYLQPGNPLKPSNGIVGEIRLTPLTHLTDGWVYCDGAILTISRCRDLFSVIGTQYGGDGKYSFAVPNLGKITGVATAGDQLGKDKLRYIICTKGAVPVRGQHGKAASTRMLYKGDRERYTAEVILFAGDFAPQNWSFCDGKKLPIRGYTGLFSMIGTIYGGDGMKTFAVPNCKNVERVWAKATGVKEGKGPRYVIQTYGVYPSR
ncbi:MAG: tail fiber protein [Akkermansiaceae bacterium]